MANKDDIHKTAATGLAALGSKLSERLDAQTASVRLLGLNQWSPSSISNATNEARQRLLLQRATDLLEKTGSALERADTSIAKLTQQNAILQQQVAARELQQRVLLDHRERAQQVTLLRGHTVAELLMLLHERASTLPIPAHESPLNPTQVCILSVLITLTSSSWPQIKLVDLGARVRIGARQTHTAVSRLVELGFLKTTSMGRAMTFDLSPLVALLVPQTVPGESP